MNTWELVPLGNWAFGYKLIFKRNLEYWCSHEDPNYTPNALYEVFLSFYLIAPFHLLVISLVIQLHSFYY